MTDEMQVIQTVLEHTDAQHKEVVALIEKHAGWQDFRLRRVERNLTRLEQTANHNQTEAQKQVTALQNSVVLKSEAAKTLMADLAGSRWFWVSIILVIGALSPTIVENWTSLVKVFTHA